MGRYEMVEAGNGGFDERARTGHPYGYCEDGVLCGSLRITRTLGTVQKAAVSGAAVFVE